MPAEPSVAVAGRGGPGSGVLSLRLVPGDARGLLDEALLDRLASACTEAAQAIPRVVLLEGARDDLFAAGTREADSSPALTAARRHAIAAWESLEATTVAVVRGACLDDAVDLLLAADLVVAFPSATFARARLRAGAGGQRLSAAALDELFGRGDAIATERAVANGLVDLVVRSEEELDSRIASLAGTAGEEVRRVKRAARELAR